MCPGADETHHRHVRREFAQISRDVCRAAGIVSFAIDFHDWHRRFRRNAANATPDEFVQNQIADHEDALRFESGKQLLKTSEIHGWSVSVTAAKSRGIMIS